MSGRPDIHFLGAFDRKLSDPCRLRVCHHRAARLVVVLCKGIRVLELCAEHATAVEEALLGKERLVLDRVLSEGYFSNRAPQNFVYPLHGRMHGGDPP